MHYFKFNIKDYHYATKHFSFAQHGAYLHLMSLYYETEKPLSLDIDELVRLCIARNEEEINAIKYILEHFFTKTEDGFIQKRAMAELEAYKNESLKKSQASRVRWDKQKNASAMQVDSTSNAKQEPETIKQETHVSRPMDVKIGRAHV